jgi:hypothetical protein
VADNRAGVLMQQMRLGTALAESGPSLRAASTALMSSGRTRHRRRRRLAGHQPPTGLPRRNPSPDFLQTQPAAALSGIRVGTKEKKLADIALP